MKFKRAPRPYKFTLLLSADEQAQLHELADRDGVSASTYLRLVIRTKAELTLMKRKGRRTR